MRTDIVVDWGSTHWSKVAEWSTHTGTAHDSHLHWNTDASG